MNPTERAAILAALAEATRLVEAVSVPDATPVPEPEPERLTWAPPPQDDPLVWTVRKDDAGSRNVKGLNGRDVIITSDTGTIDGPLSVYGGRHVRIIGQTIHAPGSARPCYLQAATGSVFVEGVHITGTGLREGINLHQALGADVYIQNVLVDPIEGTLAGQHADIIQTWAGSGRLLIDRVDGTSNYQGLFLDPYKYGMAGEHDIRNVVVRGVGSSGFWQSGIFPVTTTGCVVITTSTKTRTQLLRRGTGNPDDPWVDVELVKADEGEVAAYPTPLLGTPGAGYQSPGYQAA